MFIPFNDLQRKLAQVYPHLQFGNNVREWGSPVQQPAGAPGLVGAAISAMPQYLAMGGGQKVPMDQPVPSPWANIGAQFGGFGSQFGQKPQPPMEASQPMESPRERARRQAEQQAARMAGTFRR